jgi:tRNA(Ile)-lysidine synthase
MTDKVLRLVPRVRTCFPPASAVVCAVSGGPTPPPCCTACSPCKRRARHRRLSRALQPPPARAESDRDEAFVRSLCETGESLEEAARVLRYAFFDSLGCKVATAHTADDNLETVLLNLLRGTSLRGLCGIPPARGRIVRPLLGATQAEVEDYLQKNALAHVEDSSNQEDACRRNRLRHEVLPLLLRENPALPESLLRACSLLRQDEQELESLAAAALKKARRPGGVCCSCLAAESGAVRTRALRQLLGAIRAPKLSASHIDAVDRLLVSGPVSGRCSLPGGWTAAREYDLLTLSKVSAPPAFSPVRLAVPGVTDLPGLGLSVRCAFVAAAEKIENTPSRFLCGCDTIAHASPLFARPRAGGDAMRLPGGSRTAQEALHRP